MTSVSSIALSGLNAASLRLESSAHNIANLQTPEFRRQQVRQQAQPGGGVSAEPVRAERPGDALAEDIVAQMQASIDYRANLQVLKTQDALLGRLLDTRA